MSTPIIEFNHDYYLTNKNKKYRFQKQQLKKTTARPSYDDDPYNSNNNNNNNVSNDPRKSFVPTHCATTIAVKNDKQSSTRKKNQNRMRGGGVGVEYPADVIWYNNRFAESPAARLEGGGCCSGSQTPAPTTLSSCCGKQTTITDYHHHHSNNSSRCKKAQMTNLTQKTPEHMIKAFQEVQDFVDNVGKVPGLAGLGINEGLYFGGGGGNKTIANKHEIVSKKKPMLIQEGTIAVDFEPTDQTRINNKESVIKKLDTSSIVENIKKKSERKSKVIKKNDDENNQSLMRDTNKNDRNRGGTSSSALTRKSKKKKSKVAKFDYGYGIAYPSSVYGHKKCNQGRRRVPANMGWSWNQIEPMGKMRSRPGWRPGAISLTLKELLKEARDGFFKQANKRPLTGAGKKSGKNQKNLGSKKQGGGVGGHAGGGGCEEQETEEDVEYPPTLHVHRKDGIYYVTMYPIRQPDKTGATRIDEPINPLQFKIVKSKESLASSSTASDMEIEFSPPAAVNRIKKQPDVVHVETQVVQAEIIEATKITSSTNDGKKKQQNKNTNNKSKK